MGEAIRRRAGEVGGTGPVVNDRTCEQGQRGYGWPVDGKRLGLGQTSHHLFVRHTSRSLQSLHSGHKVAHRFSLLGRTPPTTKVFGLGNRGTFPRYYYLKRPRKRSVVRNRECRVKQLS